MGRVGEEFEKLQEHWKFEATPAFIVYDRAGKLAGVFSPDPVPYKQEDIEKRIKALLETKP